VLATPEVAFPILLRGLGPWCGIQTWSWAGWSVPLDYPIPECEHGLKINNTEDRVEIWIENLEGSHLNLDEDENLFLIKGPSKSICNFIHLEAPTIPLDIKYMPGKCAAKAWTAGFRNTSWPQNLSGYFAVF
jgi:hypothetical protein